MNLRKTFGLMGATVALLALSAGPLSAFDGAMGPAAGPSRFGADLSSKPFPDNAGGDNAQTCDEAPANACVRVMTQAYGANGRLKAPRNGTITKLKIIAMDGGTARLYFARLDPNNPMRAKLTRRGPAFSYDGQPDNAVDGVIDTIDIPNVIVKKGEVIAIKAVKFSGLRGNSGGIRHLEFQPQPPVGGGYATADDDNSFHMLVQLIYTN